MNSLAFRVYEIFKSKFSEQDAAVLIEYFEAKTENKYEQKKDIFLTNDDKIELIGKIEITKSDLIERIESIKTDLIKWMFAFWVGTIGIAILFYLLKK